MTGVVSAIFSDTLGWMGPLDGHQFGLAHQASPERAALDALGGAATVQIDGVVAKLLAELCSTR